MAITYFQESTTILNARTKKSGNVLNAPRIINFILKIYRNSHGEQKYFLNISNNNINFKEI